MGSDDVVYDFVIAGQGLAGTVLSYRLMEEGFKVLVADPGHVGSSSAVAAGLFNPITGRKMNKTWWADRLFGRLVPFYKELEALLGRRFLHELPIYRPFLSIEEQNDWQSRAADERYSGFVRELFTQPRFAESVNDPFGGLELQPSGWLEIPVLLEGYRAWLAGQGALLGESLNISEAFVADGVVHVGDLRARFLVDCTGVLAKTNRWFNWLPFRPVKGEVIEVEADFAPNCIVNRGVFVVPQGDGTHRVGSTYHWQELGPEPRPEGIEELEGRLSELLKVPWKRTGAVAGIRPATKDRRPVLGAHPEQKELLVFNGLGTKGVSLAPVMADVFCAWVKGTEPLPEEVNIKRFFSLYSTGDGV